MFRKGPPSDVGFMWCDDEHWTEDELEGLGIVQTLVLANGWESSGYGYMMRKLQSKLKECDYTM